MRRYSNTAVATTITAAIDATQTTIPLAAVTGWPVPTGGDIALAQIDAEMVTYTGITALDVTGCTRGVDGTAAAAHASGAAVVHVGSAADLEAIQTKAPLASPALTGTPTAPTAAPGTNTTQIATTAFVGAAVAAGGGGGGGPATAIAESSGPTTLAVGAIGDHAYTRRIGTDLVGVAGVSPARLSGQWYTATTATTFATGGRALAPNTLYAMPIDWDGLDAVAGLEVWLRTALAGNLRMGVYDGAGSLYPADLLADPGAVGTSSTGLLSVTFAPVTPGPTAERLWLTLLSDVALDLNLLSVAPLPYPLGLPDTQANRVQWGYSVAYTYGALPATFPASAAILNTVSPGMPWFMAVKKG